MEMLQDPAYRQMYAQMMQNPEYRQSMMEMLSNPQALQSMMDMYPGMQNMLGGQDISQMVKLLIVINSGMINLLSLLLLLFIVSDDITNG